MARKRPRFTPESGFVQYLRTSDEEVQSPQRSQAAQRRDIARYKRWVEIDPQQAQVWRYAWDLLLQDAPTLDDICEALASGGYRLRSGVPFVHVNARGKPAARKTALSKAFHNWFYAGWVVVDNDWA